MTRKSSERDQQRAFLERDSSSSRHPGGSWPKENPDFAKSGLDIWVCMACEGVRVETLPFIITTQTRFKSSNMRLKSTLLIFLSTACLFWHSPLCSASDSLLERHDESDVSYSDATFHVARSRGLKSKGGKTYEEAGYYRPSYMYHRPHVPDYGGGYDQSGVYGGYDGYGAYGGYYYGNFQSGSKKSKAYQQYPVYYHPKSQKKAKKSYNYVVVNPLPPLEGREEAQTIYEIINQIVNLSTLASLVNSPGQENVVRTLDGEGPVTLFAPLNSAFDELFATVDPSSLTDEELSNALNYHIVAGRLRKRLLIVAQQGILFALNGETISYMANGREVTLNEDALIIKGNIRATNGIIHVIDKGKDNRSR